MTELYKISYNLSEEEIRKRQTTKMINFLSDPKYADRPILFLNTTWKKTDYWLSSKKKEAHIVNLYGYEQKSKTFKVDDSNHSKIITASHDELGNVYAVLGEGKKSSKPIFTLSGDEGMACVPDYSSFLNEEAKENFYKFLKDHDQKDII
jgi:hypothetical protein